MAAESIDVETREWLDRLEIQDLIHRYSDGVTRADWQQCEAVFTPDATWESSGLGIRCEDRASFMEILRATSSYDLLIQTAHSSVITLIDAHHARSTTTIHEFIRETAGAENNLEHSGALRDLLRRPRPRRRQLEVHPSSVLAHLRWKRLRNRRFDHPTVGIVAARLIEQFLSHRDCSEFSCRKATMRS
jgi:SnoaL-like domain